jgi:hypothetical protein
VKRIFSIPASAARVGAVKTSVKIGAAMSAAILILRKICILESFLSA